MLKCKILLACQVKTNVVSAAATAIYLCITERRAITPPKIIMSILRIATYSFRDILQIQPANWWFLLLIVERGEGNIFKCIDNACCLNNVELVLYSVFLTRVCGMAACAVSFA